MKAVTRLGRITNLPLSAVRRHVSEPPKHQGRQSGEESAPTFFRSGWGPFRHGHVAIFSCGIAAVGVLAVVALARPEITAIYVGLLACIILSIVVQLLANSQRLLPSTRLLDVPFSLARDPEVFERYRDISLSLLQVTQQVDPIYREIALEHLTSLATRAATIGDGTIVFEDTETWRLVYSKLLRSPGIHLYRSVAWMKTADYWQDQPGLQSMRLNFELRNCSQISIERVVIIHDDLWPTDSDLPIEPVHQWIAEQHNHGIEVQLVRQSALATEPDLLADIGIYGSRAVGVQELDEDSHTLRFTLTFDFDELTKAEDRWRRLSVYAMPYRDILNHFTLE